jgi:DNA-binding transcriptional ArsR family regulator
MTSYREPARLLRLMAHPMRLEILTIVRWSDECVCHLSAAVKRPQPYVSQQLAVLRNAGLIADHKEGNNVFYGLASGRAAAQVAAILRAINEEDPAVSSAGHQHVAGCYCPKCEPEGTCSPPGDRAEAVSVAEIVV